MSVTSFRQWRNHEAMSIERLSRVLRLGKSDNPLEGLIRGALLFLYYLYYLIHKVLELIIFSLREPAESVRTVDEIAGALLEKSPPSFSAPPPARAAALDASAAAVTSPAVAVARPPTPERANAPALAIEAFLKDMIEATRNESEDAARELGRLRKQDNRIFTALLFSAFVTITLAAAGAVLLFQKSFAFGVVSEVVGLLPGSGTLILRRLSKNTQKRLNEVTNSRQDNLAVLRAIQAAQLIEDPIKRSNQITAIASDLRERARRQRRSLSSRPGPL